MDRSASANECSSYMSVSESGPFVDSVRAHLRDGFFQLLCFGLRMFNFLFEANVFFFFLGQVFADIYNFSFELLVSLFTLLVICLQRIVVGEVARVVSVELFDIPRSPSLYRK